MIRLVRALLDRVLVDRSLAGCFLKSWSGLEVFVGGVFSFFLVDIFFRKSFDPVVLRVPDSSRSVLLDPGHSFPF